MKKPTRPTIPDLIVCIQDLYRRNTILEKRLAKLEHKVNPAPSIWDYPVPGGVRERGRR